MLLSRKIILSWLTVCLGNKKSAYVPVMLYDMFFVKPDKRCVMHINRLDGGVAVSYSVILKVEKQTILRIYVKLGWNWYLKEGWENLMSAMLMTNQTIISCEEPLGLCGCISEKSPGNNKLKGQKH